MKKILKSLGICLGLILINQLIIGFIAVISAIFLKAPEDISKHIYTIAFTGNLITLILVHLMFSVYDKKLLSKDTLKKIEFKEAIYISLLAIGITVILLSLTGVLTKLIPSYMDVQNQLQSASNSILQLIIIIILIPICEEIIFRHVIFGHLKENYNIVFAVIVQALVFGLAHGNVVQGIYTFLLGIALALMYMYSNSLVGSIILHMIFNLFGILIIPKLAAISPIMQPIIIVFAIVCLVISLLKMMKKYENVLYK